MSCKLCQEFYEKHKSTKKFQNTLGKIKCAFENDVFSSDNWNCETMLLLRKISGEYDYDQDKQEGIYFYRDDERAANIGVICIEENEDIENVQQGYLIMSWYKRRGRTGQAYIFWDEKEPRLLTLKTAEFIISKG